MGFRVSIYAIFDRDPDLVRRDLNLKPNGDTEEFPESAVAGVLTNTGTYVLYFNDSQMFGDDVIRPLIANSRFLSCNVNETCMYSAVTAFDGGGELWRVIHDSSKGILHLETHGDIPTLYSAIREQKLSRQQHDGEGVDHMFGVPIDLFVQLGGVRYDEDIDSDNPKPWHTLVPTKSPKSKWWPFAK